MARIFVSYYKKQETSIQVIQAFWDGFIHDLRDCGNDVLVINTAYFNGYSSNEVKSRRISDMILKKVTDFDPELIITFNHRIPLCVLEGFPNVPTVIWDGDSPAFQCDWPYIMEHLERYHFFTISREWEKEYIEKGIDPERVHYIPVATSVRKRDMEQDKNVSFVGARAYYDRRMVNNLRAKKSLRSIRGVVQEFNQTHNFDYAAYSTKYFAGYNVTPEQLHPLFDYRWLTLSNMIDLGLTIAGHESRWEVTAEYMPQLMACYSPVRVWTNEENENFFNSSKVSLCPIHPQAAGDAFSWRVFDIMASNSCLLVSESSQLRELTKGYVDLPMYSDPWEARQMCIELLNDDEKRMKIVRDCQRYIEENARWIHRFKQAEGILGLSLVNEGEGSLLDLYLEDEDMLALRASIRGTRVSLLTRIKKNSALYKDFNAHKFQYIKEATMLSFALIMLGALSLMFGRSDLELMLFGNSGLIASEVLKVIGDVLCSVGILGTLLIGAYIIRKVIRKLLK